jgi:NitT/TauT family transport system substrate-binding protein
VAPQSLIKKLAVLSTVGVLFTALAACGGSDDKKSTEPAETPTSEETSEPAPAPALRMQLSWLPQAQFAGFLVADAKGYYDEAGLDVSILPGGPNVNNIQQLVSGEADLAVDRVSTLFQSRDKGVPIKGIAEFDQESGFWLVGKKSEGINAPEDLEGKKVGIFADNEFEYNAMLDEMGIDKGAVKTFFQGFTMEPWLNDEYPVAQVTSWNELQTIYESGVSEDDLTIFKPTDYGVGVLHGAILANEDIINSDPAALTAFVEATMKGWTFAFENPEEAIDIVMDAAQDADRQHEMDSLEQIKSTQWGDSDTAPEGWGTIPMDSYEETAAILEGGDYVDNDVDVEGAVDTSIAK